MPKCASRGSPFQSMCRTKLPCDSSSTVSWKRWMSMWASSWTTPALGSLAISSISGSTERWLPPSQTRCSLRAKVFWAKRWPRERQRDCSSAVSKAASTSRVCGHQQRARVGTVSRWKSANISRVASPKLRAPSLVPGEPKESNGKITTRLAGGWGFGRPVWGLMVFQTLSMWKMNYPCCIHFWMRTVSSGHLAEVRRSRKAS